MVSKNSSAPTIPNDDAGWTEVQSDKGDLAHWAEGVSMQGVYLGTGVVDFVDNDTHEPATAVCYLFEGTYGRWWTWGAYAITQAMDEITEGEEVRITCTGSRKAKKGEVKLFKILHRPGALQLKLATDDLF